MRLRRFLKSGVTDLFIEKKMARESKKMARESLKKHTCSHGGAELWLKLLGFFSLR